MNWKQCNEKSPLLSLSPHSLWLYCFCFCLSYSYWPNSQIPECTCSMSHNAPFGTEMFTFQFWMVYSGMWNRCVMGFVRLVHCLSISMSIRPTVLVSARLSVCLPVLLCHSPSLCLPLSSASSSTLPIGSSVSMCTSCAFVITAHWPVRRLMIRWRYLPWAK